MAVMIKAKSLRPGGRRRGVGGGGAHVMPGCSFVTVDPRIPTYVQRRDGSRRVSTHQAGRHCLHGERGGVVSSTLSLVEKEDHSIFPGKEFLMISYVGTVRSKSRGTPPLYVCFSRKLFPAEKIWLYVLASIRQLSQPIFKFFPLKKTSGVLFMGGVVPL